MSSYNNKKNNLKINQTLKIFNYRIQKIKTNSYKNNKNKTNLKSKI